MSCRDAAACAHHKPSVLQCNLDGLSYRGTHLRLLQEDPYPCSSWTGVACAQHFPFPLPLRKQPCISVYAACAAALAPHPALPPASSLCYRGTSRRLLQEACAACLRCGRYRSTAPRVGGCRRRPACATGAPNCACYRRIRTPVAAGSGESPALSTCPFPLPLGQTTLHPSVSCAAAAAGEPHPAPATGAQPVLQG